MVTSGYAVFMPFRRGVQDTTPASAVGSIANRGFWNTGVALQDWVDATMSFGDADENAQFTLAYMNDEATVDTNDAVTAFSKVVRTSGVRVVDPARIAVIGHSYGGAI